MKKIYKIALLTAVLSSVSTLSFAAKYNWTFQSSDQPGDQAFQIQLDWAKDVYEKSDKQIKINIVGAGAVVEANQTLTAVKNNILQGDMTDPSYFTGKDPAFALYGNLIGAWGKPMDMIDFVYNGGGFKVINQLLNRYGVQLLAISTVGNESFVSKKPLRNIADLQGVKLRAPEGMVQDLFKSLGAAPVNLPGSEVYTSLEKGVIDGADYSIFARNQAQGLNTIAKFPIYPGWHSTPANQVTINKKVYDRLPAHLKKVLAEEGRYYSTHFLKVHQELDKKAIANLKGTGETLISWKPSELVIVRQHAVKLWQKWGNESKMGKLYYKTVTTYLKDKGLLK